MLNLKKFREIFRYSFDFRTNAKSLKTIQYKTCQFFSKLHDPIFQKNLQDKIQKATFENQRKNYDLSQHHLTEILTIMKGEQLENDPSNVFIYYLMAKNLFEKNNDARGQEMALKALSLAKDNEEDPTILKYVIYSHVLLGTYYLKIGNYLEAENHLLQSITKQRELIGRNDDDLAAHCELLGNIYLKTKRADKALSQYKDAFDLLGNDSQGKIRTASKIADIYIKDNKYEQALQYYEKAKKNIADESHIALINSKQANVAALLKRTKEALQFIETAEELAMKSTNNPLFPSIINNISKLYHDLGLTNLGLSKFKGLLGVISLDTQAIKVLLKQLVKFLPSIGSNQDAIEYLQSLIQNHIQRTNPVSEALVYYYLTLGTFQQETRQFSESLVSYQQAIKITEKNPEVRSEIPYILTCISQVQKTIGNLDQCLDAAYEAVEIVEKYFPKFESEKVEAYTNLGYMLANLGGFKDAIIYFEKALNSAISAYGQKHIVTARAYINTGQTLSSLNHHSDALDFIKNGLSIIKQISGENDLDYINGVLILSTALDQAGKKDLALSQSLMATKSLIEMHGELNPELISAYLNLAMRYRSNGKFEEALGYYDKVVEIDLKLKGAPDLNTSHIYEEIGKCFLQMNQKERAKEYFERCKTILKRDLPNNHPTLQRVEKFLSTIV